MSADGRQHRTLLDKFENVTEPKDVWLSPNEKELYVCGGEFIDIYQLPEI